MTIVSLSSLLPYRNPDNAGARYLDAVARAWRVRHTLYVPDGDASRRAASHESAPNHVLLGGMPRRSRTADAARRVIGMALPVLPRISYLWGVLRDRAVRQDIRSADIIDVQWEENAVLLPALRLLNPSGRIVCTLHDVLSQRFARSAAASSGGWRRARWRWAEVVSRRLERLILRFADVVVVFSDKDRDLLPTGRAAVYVVSPPPPGINVVRDIDPGLLLFVGALYRHENAEGLAWFLRDVFPEVRRAHPHARLAVAGAGAGEELKALAAASGANLLGFVDDLTPLYGAAAAVVVPLRRGAGTKFKVVDALVAGVPTVTTSVGAEGIGTADLYAGVVDDAPGFSRCVSSVLEASGHFEHIARRSRDWALRNFTFSAFEDAIKEIYRVDKGEPVGSDESTTPEVSVIIPVRNGAATLGEQLESLGCQEDAPSFEVIVSDNGSSDGTAALAERFRDRLPSLRIVDSSAVAGVSRARNAGVVSARAAKVVFCDADDRVSPKWLRALSNALDEFDVVGGTARPHGAQVDTELALAPTGLGSALGFLPYGIGASLGARRDVYIEIGGMDESFRRGHEEVDFAWRAQLRGFTLGWAADAVIEYRQRTEPWAALRQSRNYAASGVQLWSRYADAHTLMPVSFKGSMKALVGDFIASVKLIDSTHRVEQARSLGWSLGLLIGHARYRMLRKDTVPELMAPMQDAGTLA